MILARSTGRVMTVEDHWPEGGIGEAVFEALATAGIGVAGSLLAPRKMPGSATPVEEIADAGIDAAAIVAAANDLMTKQRPEPVAAAANR